MNKDLSDSLEISQVYPVWTRSFPLIIKTQTYNGAKCHSGAKSRPCSFQWNGDVKTLFEYWKRINDMALYSSISTIHIMWIIID